MSAICVGVGTDADLLWYDGAIVVQAEAVITKVPSAKRKYLAYMDGTLSDEEIAAATGLTVADVVLVGRACVAVAGG